MEPLVIVALSRSLQGSCRVADLFNFKPVLARKIYGMPKSKTSVGDCLFVRRPRSGLSQNDFAIAQFFGLPMYDCSRVSGAFPLVEQGLC